MLSRDWQCLNGRCRATFHSYAHGNPTCPRCGCVRCTWVPGGGHVSTTKGFDTTLRSLAQSYGMTDINSASPSRLNRSMPKHDPVIADGPTLQFAPGFAAPYSRAGRATCEPSHQRVDFKVTAEAGKQVVPDRRYGPAIGASNWKGLRRPYKS